uniref:Desmoplakin n=1 Tax=Periophthalmus magnuspinnatus TaxID=409849 RepID=A0A3B3ZC30_9GOBI
MIFDGVRKPVTAKQLHECDVIDKPTLKDLQAAKKSIPEISVEKKVNLKGTSPIAGIILEKRGKVSLSEAKKEMLLSPECADLLLEAQAATGHIIDLKNNKKLTVDEACTNETVDSSDRDRLMEAEKAAVGYKDPYSAKPLSVFEAMKKGLVDDDTGLRLLQAQESVGGILDPKLSVFLPKYTAIKRKILDENTDRSLKKSPNQTSVVFEAMKKGLVDDETGLRLLQAQESVGGILDPNLSVFLPKDTAIERKILDENANRSLTQNPKCYIDPETEEAVSYNDLKKRCKTEPKTGLLLLPVTEKLADSELIFDGLSNKCSFPPNVLIFSWKLRLQQAI